MLLKVMGRMSFRRQNLQILDSVVRLDPVLVVDNLLSLQGSAQLGFHYVPML